jgi:PIN domain nuclease of toxin-antitoxin system
MGLPEVILLDTHVVIWFLSEGSRLSTRARDAISQARGAGGLAVASVTLYELAQLAACGRITVRPSVDALLNEVTQCFAIRNITAHIALASTQFNAPYPRDPMDRLIGATALVEGIPLVTADERIQNSGQIQTIW